MLAKQKQYADFPFAGKFRELLEENNGAEQELSVKLGITSAAFRQWTNGYTLPTCEKLKTIAEHFGVTSDCLLGRARATAPDDFIQEVVNRYGLSEKALNFLEQLNAPRCVDKAEGDRIIKNQKEREDYFEKYAGINGKLDVLNTAFESGFVRPENLSPVDWEKLKDIMRHEQSQNILSILNDILSTPVESAAFEWETFGTYILRPIYEYCRRDFKPIEVETHDITGKSTHKISVEKLRQIEILELNENVASLRKKLTGEG